MGIEHVRLHTNISILRRNMEEMLKQLAEMEAVLGNMPIEDPKELDLIGDVASATGKLDLCAPGAFNSMLKSTPEFRQLVALVGNHRCANELQWLQWARLIMDFNWKNVIAACNATPAGQRWPGYVEELLVAKRKEKREMASSRQDSTSIRSAPAITTKGDENQCLTTTKA